MNSVFQKLKATPTWTLVLFFVLIIILIGIVNHKAPKNVSKQAQETAIIASRVVETHPKAGVVCFVYVYKSSNSISCIKDFSAVAK